MEVANVSVGRQVGEHARVFIGYTFQHMSHVARLGDALDPAATGVRLTGFTVQSINFGLELRY